MGCKAILNSFLAAMVLLACSFQTARGQPAQSGSAAPDRNKTVVIKLSGTVDDYNRDALLRRFREARTLGAGTIILQLDTYGGLVTAGLDISRFIKNQTDLHTIAFINDKAISAGAMIALACDEIVMTPSGTLGDCAPIEVSPQGGMQTMGDTERGKIESPILADFQESAERNGYDPLVASAMVSLPYSVYWVQNGSDQRKFVDAAAHKTLTGDGWQAVEGVPNPIDDEKHLLTVHTDLATKIGLAKGIASGAEALAAQRGLSIRATLAPGAGEGLVALLSGSFVRLILLTIFLQSLYIALHVPGHGAAEAVATLSLALLVGIPLLTGYAQWWEIAFIFGGLALMAFEIFVFPGHGVSLIVGMIMVLFGLVMTFAGNAGSLPGSWRLPAVWSGVETGVKVVVGGMACSVLLSLWLRRYLPRIPYFNRLILTSTSGDLASPARSATTAPPADTWPFVGTIGHAATDLKPGGSAEFPYGSDTRITAVISEAGFVPAGMKVAVREVRGNKVVVRSIPGA